MSDQSPEQPSVSQEQESPTCPACQSSRCQLFPVLVIVFIVVAVVAVYHRRSHDELIGPPVLEAEAKNLPNTLVTPHLESPIDAGKNLLWCSTFQLVWNETCRIAGGDLHMENEPAIVPPLNKKSATESDLDPQNHLVISGKIEDGIVKKIRQELDRQFRGQASPTLLDRIATQLPPEGYLAYAYLFVQLPFEYRFRQLDEPIKFGDKRVASFGLPKTGLKPGDHHIAEQVSVLDYAGPDDFIVELKPKDRKERIILAKIAPAENLQKTIDAVHGRAAATKLNNWQKMFHEHEPLAVPVLNFDLWQEYDDLYEKPITTPGPLEKLQIVLALQNIRFRLDQNGAMLKSEAAMKEAKSAEARNPRQFIFDKPFLILLQRGDAKQPYFALWVDNPELLVPAR